MSDISKEELKKEIAAILKDADLDSITSKKVRQDIEKKLEINLFSRRKEVDELVMDFIIKDKGKKRNGDVEDEDEDEEDEEEEEEEEVKKPKRRSSKKGTPAKKFKNASSDESDEASDGEGDDEYSPKKKAAKKPAAKRGAGRKKKGGSDDDSDEDWGKGKKRGGSKKAGGAKRTGGGYTKALTLSPELAAVVGEAQMARHEVVKKIWAIIKERNLYDPSNKQFAICDDELLKVFGVKRFRTFGMMKFLNEHFRG